MGVAQREHIVPIPGTKKITRLQENIGALQVELTLSECQQLGKLFGKEKVKGARYPEGLSKLSDQ